MQLPSRSPRCAAFVLASTILFVATTTTPLRAQSSVAAVKVISPSGLWQEIDEKPTLATHGGLSAATIRLGVVPKQYRVLHLDRAKLSAVFDATAPEGTLHKALADGAPLAALPAPAELELPIPRSAAFARFTIEASPVMDPALAARYPGIRTFVAQGIDNPELTARLDVTPLGFHALILSPGGQIVIDPYFLDGSDPATSIAYYKRDYAASKPMPCLFQNEETPAAMAERIARSQSPVLSKPTGASLRVYRLAVGTTAEYAAAVGGGDTTLTLGAVVTTVNRVDLVYEKDFAIRMMLVANEDKMIFTNTSTEPYTDSDPSSLLSQNQTTCDSVIGTANYDIGHVFSTAGGGLADLGVVSTAGYKAMGETGTSDPVGDPYDIDYVAHEMGHQFGANHPFNSTTGNCGGGNRSAAHAYEPGSGTTIMAYAGICSDSTYGVQDLAPHSDDYFLTGSYDEIDAYTSTGNGKNAYQTIATGNTPPTLGALTAYTIPISTPFALTASATDPNGDTLTYCWEEFDLGPAVNATTTSALDNGQSPIFRSYPPTTSPTRLFPSLTYILNNVNVPPLRGTVDGNFLVGEALPSVARAKGLNFRCTVRDNHAGGGGSNYALVTLAVATGAGPFAITAPNTAVSYAAGASVPVTWNVANTAAAPVSCASVKISLSTDGGLTFPYVLASTVPNDGAATVILPTAASVATTQARIKVEALGNIFFDINDANFTITSANTPPAFASNNSGITVTRGTPTATVATVGTAAAGSSPLSSVSVSGAPFGATVTGAIVGGNVQLSATAACRLTTTLSTRTYPLNVTVTDTAGATASGTVSLLVASNPTPTLGTYAATSVPAGSMVTVTPSAAPADSNGNLLPSPLAISPTTPPPAGMTLSLNQTTGALTVATTAATAQGAVALRVQVQDTCGATLERAVTVTVTAPPTTSAPAFTSAVPSGGATAGVAYNYTFVASGTPAPTYAVTAGTLPPGLTLNATTGVLSGTPTTPGVYGGVQVTASNGTAPNATQTFSLTVVDTVGHYLAAAGLSGANASPAADPDGDGLTNLMEYALHLNPTQPDAGSNGVPETQATLRNYSGTNYLSIRFTRVPLATDITYIVESSPDLAAWTAVATGAGGAALTGPGVVSDDAASTVPHTVEVRDTVAETVTGGQRRFLRLRVTQP